MTREAYVTGLGQSEIGVRLTRDPLLLTVDALKEALADAGLRIEQIDGVATYPGRTQAPPGFSPVGAPELIDALGMRATWHMGGVELTSQLGAIVAAADAVRAGHARHVLCFRTIYEAAALARGVKGDWIPAGVTGESQWFMPFFAMSSACWVAQYASRHCKTYGLTREQLGQIAVNAHANASVNPRAIVKKPLSLDDYMKARMISSPLCLYDCDRFTDASTVIIVSASDAIDEVTSTPIRIAGSAAAVERCSWDQADWMACYATGRQFWRSTDYRPEDVDVAQIYDGFSFMTIAWLEALGFCELGEGGKFVEDGKRIGRSGALPLNTSGGQLGVGRLHGFGYVHEAVVQLRGAGGLRQVPGDPKVALAAVGGGPQATVMLLTRD